MPGERQSPRQHFARLRLLLLFGLLSLSLVTAVLSVAGFVPVVPDNEWIGTVCAIVTMVVTTPAWCWARPRIPWRRAIMPLDEFWRLRGTLEALLLVLFMLEGAATLAIVGTMLSGIGPATMAGILPVFGMLALSPAWVDQRSR